MKKSLLTLALAAVLSAPTFAAEQYLVRVPANVNLSAAAPETPQEPISLSLSAEALPAATVNEPYSFNLLDRLTITGGSGSHNYSDTVWSLKAGDVLPPGLSLSGSMIAGTPTAKNEAGTSFEVTGTYQDASGQQVYTIIVNGAELQVTQISAGYNHTCAVTTAGAAKCWGYNGHGQLGDDSTTHRATPTQVIGLEAEVASIAAGYFHTCAVTTAGAAKCWGFNGSGRLGNGSTTSRLKPSQVTGLDAGVVSIAGGGNHTCAVTAAGAAKCWGSNDYGQLGDGTTKSRTTPVQVAGLGAGVESLTAGSDHTCAVTTTGGAKCWGAGTQGQLGNGYFTDNKNPVQVTGLETGVSSLTAGNSHTCAVTTVGGAKCWGDGGSGRLGDGSMTDRKTPVQVFGLDAGVGILTAGYDHTCAVMTAGGAKCWGFNGSGRLGDGSITTRTKPVQVLGLEAGVGSLTAGNGHTCAVTTSGAAKCWGHNVYGKLGDGTETDRTTPVDVLP